MGALRRQVTDLHWLSCSDRRNVEIVDEAGNLCSINVEGTIRSSLNELDCAAYLDDPEATRKMFRAGYIKHPWACEYFLLQL